MKNRLILVADKHDPEECILFHQEYCASRGLELHIVPTQFEALKLTTFGGFLPDDPVLFIQGPLLRVRNIECIQQWHRQNEHFPIVRLGPKDSVGPIVSFIPRDVKIQNGQVIMKDEASFPFNVENYHFEWQKPQIEESEIPRILLYTYNRPEYLKLTLNSLVYSLNGDEGIPLTILLNDSPPETKRVAAWFLEKYSFVDVLEVTPNSKLSALNVGIQWYYQKEKALRQNLIICEDDFILPTAAREFFPWWVYQFMARLRKLELVGWSCQPENSPEWYPTTPFKGERCDWVYEDLQVYLQNLAMKTKYYIQNVTCTNHHHFSAPDTLLHGNSKGTCTPGTRGYHIGWNQIMDFNMSLYKEGRFSATPWEVKVTDLRTWETRNIVLEDIVKLKER